MKHNLFIISFLFSIKSFGFIQFIEKAVDAAQNAIIYTDAARDIAEAIEPEGSDSGEINGVRNNMGKIRDELSDLGYSASEIKDIMSSGGLESGNLVDSLYKLSNKVRKTRNLMAKVGLLAIAKPEAVTAGESLKSTALLSDIHYELKLARLDRVRDRQEIHLAKLEKEREKQETRNYLISQLDQSQGKKLKITNTNFAILKSSGEQL